MGGDLACEEVNVGLGVRRALRCDSPAVLRAEGVGEGTRGLGDERSEVGGAESVLDGAVDDAVDMARVAEADFCFGWVDVDVDGFG